MRAKCEARIGFSSGRGSEKKLQKLVTNRTEARFSSGFGQSGVENEPLCVAKERNRPLGRWREPCAGTRWGGMEGRATCRLRKKSTTAKFPRFSLRIVSAFSLICTQLARKVGYCPSVERMAMH